MQHEEIKQTLMDLIGDYGVRISLGLTPTELSQVEDFILGGGAAGRIGLGSHLVGRKENELYVLRWGYTLTNDHTTTGEEWARLREKQTGEDHSGFRDELELIFHGHKDIDSLYAPPFSNNTLRPSPHE